MIDIQAIRRFLPRLKVPDMKFELGDRVGSVGVRFIIIHRTKDSETGKPITIATSFTMPTEFFSEKELVDWLHQCVRLRYQHEADEAFTIDGAAPFHPHVDGAQEEALSMLPPWKGIVSAL